MIPQAPKRLPPRVTVLTTPCTCGLKPGKGKARSAGTLRALGDVVGDMLSEVLQHFREYLQG